MEMLSGYLPNTRPSSGSFQARAEVACGEIRRVDRRASKRLNSDSTPVLHSVNNDWMIVRQAIAGSTAAQEDLFGRNRPKLYRIALGILQNKEDAEDALQDGLCKAYSRLQSFQGRSSFSTWLTRIVLNSALMARRRKIAHPEASLDEILNNQPKQMPRGFVDPRPDPENLYAEAELNAWVEAHVSQLPPALQVPLRLHAISGFSGTHASKLLGISASAIKSRIFRARLKLAYRLYPSLDVRVIALELRKRRYMKLKG